jgi:protein-disulfide isomerase
MRKLALAVAIACAAAAGAAPLPLAAATRAQDWTKSVTVTPEGAFVLGNPKAKVRLVEYLSMTCSHCAHFTGEAMTPLTDKYVRSGQVSVEIRHAIRDSLDIAATLLVRCNGARQFFANEQAILAGQDAWVADAVAYDTANPGATAKLPINDALVTLAHSAGLDRIMAGRGVNAGRAKACLSNKAEQDRLAAMAKEAWATRQIQGTPAFLINGNLVEGVSSWATLEPKLQEALR